MSNVGIRDLARVAARAVAVELVLFEAFGRWIATTSGAAAKPLLAAASHRHAWRAERWRERFPLIPDADPDTMIADERAALDPLVDALTPFDALPVGPGRLALAGLVGSVLGDRYRAVAQSIDPLVDAPTARLLTVLLADLAAASADPGELDDDERAALDAFRATDPIPTLEVP